MAIDRLAPGPTHFSRRQCLLAAAGVAWWPSARAAAPSARAHLVAAWEADNRHFIGLVSVEGGLWWVQQSIAVPTRAHGVRVESGGTVLVVARRPGDWLLRWRPGTAQTAQTAQWHWITGERRFNGHTVAHGETVWTTETNRDTAAGCVGVRQARSLEKIDEWATHGKDPHELLALPERLGAWPAGTLMVANGGISTRPETGRNKHHLERMDASLVALNPENGALLGQWWLPDPFLSIRHLAWDTSHQRLGMALQAEHLAAEDRARAPVLAVWDGDGIATASESPDLRGYGGAVAARPGGGFLVSCPRAQVLAVFDSQAGWSHSMPLVEACAVAASADGWWAGGLNGVLHATSGEGVLPQRAVAHTTLRWDNHWQVWPTKPTATRPF